MKAENFTGKTAFLNGEPGLHDIDQDLFDLMRSKGKKCEMLDNLFEEPDKLKRLPEFTNLVMFTTGLKPDNVNPLVDLFEKLNYVPKKVVFLSEGTAMFFLGMARQLKKKGTEFYFLDFLDMNNLYKVNWI